MPAARAAQEFVPVQEIRNGVIILKDGGYRGILMCSSVNFALKSEDEQRAIIGGFQNFLNTLDFSVQIVVQSRKIDIRPYLALLQERMDRQTSELMRIQLREYINFISSFIEGTDIMTKLFYVVVPFSPAPVAAVSSALPFVKKAPGGPPAEAGADEFVQFRVQLEQRMSLVASALQGSGIRAVPLGTEEIIELLYRSFNPSEHENPIRFS